MDEIDSDELYLDFAPDGKGLNLKQLYCFHAVVSEGTFVAAAKRLGVTQPSVSEQIRNLEQFLGTPLLDRRPAGVRPNAHGRRVFEHTRVMFRSARRLLQEMAPERVQDRLVLEVGLCPTISRTFATDRLLALFRMKDVLPRIRLGRYETLLEGLLGGEIDLLLSENRPSRADQAKIGLRELGGSPLIFVSSPALSQKVEKMPDDLAKLPFIHYTRESRYRWDIDACFRDYGIWPEVIAEADDVILLVNAAVEGLGVVAVPRGVATEWVEAGTLKALGNVGGASSTVFAHYQQTDPSDVVRQAVESLAG